MKFEERIGTILEAIGKIDTKDAEKVKRQIAGQKKIPSRLLPKDPKTKKELENLANEKDAEENAVAVRIAADKMMPSRVGSSVTLMTDIHDEITDAIGEYFDSVYE